MLRDLLNLTERGRRKGQRVANALLFTALTLLVVFTQLLHGCALRGSRHHSASQSDVQFNNRHNLYHQSSKTNDCRAKSDIAICTRKRIRSAALLYVILQKIDTYRIWTCSKHLLLHFMSSRRCYQYHQSCYILRCMDFTMLKQLRVNICSKIFSGCFPLRLSQDRMILNGVWIGKLIYLILLRS